jgi:hypothetical protein
MSQPEQTIAELEEAFPALSGMAFGQEQKEALAAGQEVLVSENGVIYRLTPDGNRTELKRIEPPTHVPLGTRRTIR